MKLRDIPLGSETAYLEAVEIVTDQLIAEIETCKDILGTDPEVLLALIARVLSESVEINGQVSTRRNSQYLS
jgi:hypothetical protein